MSTTIYHKRYPHSMRCENWEGAVPCLYGLCWVVHHIFWLFVLALSINFMYVGIIYIKSCLCYNLKKTWFISDFFIVVPQVIWNWGPGHNTTKQKTKKKTASYPSESALCAQDGNFRCMFFPKKYDIIHSMDQDISCNKKGCIRKGFWRCDGCDETDESQDIRSQCTLQNLKLPPKVSN
jgi:hypothetical protein